MDALQSEIEEHIAGALGRPFGPARRRTAAGGDIHQAWILEDSGGRVFVKLNRAAQRDLLETEAEALTEIATTGTIRVPHPLVHGTSGDHAFLAMEHLQLSGGSERAYGLLGERLAALHQCTASAHGWHRDNWIGATSQPNGWDDDWVRFFRDRRLRHQVELAVQRGARRIREPAERLAEALPRLFEGYTPAPSMLHGDLWGGNAAVLEDGEPVIYDPALYYGDRESDLAMTELFGGFPRSFRAGYEGVWPLDPGYATRRRLYQLYHVLNHYNLFGGGYLGRAEQLIGDLLTRS